MIDDDLEEIKYIVKITVSELSKIVLNFFLSSVYIELAL
jgi:hypothetical protein